MSAVINVYDWLALVTAAIDADGIGARLPERVNVYTAKLPI